MYYPVYIDLRDRLCVVVGGGRVAARKVEGLLECGARVTVISPELTDSLRKEGECGRISHKNRVYREGDLAQAFLAIAATPHRDVNEAVRQEAETRGVLFNAVDQPDLCNFIVPSVVRKGSLAIAISTGGKSPALARRFRERLEAEIDEPYGVFVDLLGDLRAAARDVLPDVRAREAFFMEVTCDQAFLDMIRDGRPEAAREAMLDKMMTYAAGGSKPSDGSGGSDDVN